MKTLREITWDFYRPDRESAAEVLLAESTVHAGFPSPIDDFLEGSLDLNTLIIKPPEAAFFARVRVEENLM